MYFPWCLQTLVSLGIKNKQIFNLYICIICIITIVIFENYYKMYLWPIKLYFLQALKMKKTEFILHYI